MAEIFNFGLFDGLYYYFRNVDALELSFVSNLLSPTEVKHATVVPHIEFL